MHYEINVSKDGQHLFATHKRSISTLGRLRHLVNIFDEKFPQADGYNVTMVKVTEAHYDVKREDVEL